jgi:nucleoside-diphosphate-sugar epimerase
MVTWDGIDSRRFLVTGASGFIGRAVCSHLLDHGANVVGVSRTPADGLSGIGWSQRNADLSVEEEVDRLFADACPEYVLHLAGCVAGHREVAWVRRTLLGNLVTAVNVLVAAQEADVRRIVLAGSLEEPGEIDHEPVLASPYAASKWCASAYARMFHRLYGTRVAVARIFMVYGPGQRDFRKFVPYVCLSAIRGESPQLMSGSRPVDWIYIDDVVRGLVRLCQTGPEDGTRVDLGSGRLVSTGDVAVMLCRHSGSGVPPSLGAILDRPMEQVRRADAERTQAEIGWFPEVELDEGMARTYAWYSRGVAEGWLRPEADSDTAD